MCEFDMADLPLRYVPIHKHSGSKDRARKGEQPYLED